MRPHPLLEQGSIMLTAGVYDALSAKLAEKAGFPAVVLTGYGLSATHLGEPDLGLLTQSDVLDAARRVVRAVNVPVVVDCDTGYGGPLNVKHVARELIRSGAAGMILEDQRWPKRCGHMRDKEVIDAEEHAAKIQAASDERGDEALIVVARTDALETHGIDEAIRRAKLYKEAGADVLFVEGPRDKHELGRIGAELPGPLTVNLIEGGRTPLCSLEELSEMGFFSVGFVLTGLYAAAHALQRAYTELLETGSSRGIEGEMISFDDFNELLGLSERYAEEEKYRK